MPTIHIEYDDSKVSDEEAQQLSIATQKIVSEATNIEDVFVYGNSARIKIQVAPVEIFIQMSDHKINNLDELFDAIKLSLHTWRESSGFKHPVNLTLIPMHWKFEVAI